MAKGNNKVWMDNSGNMAMVSAAIGLVILLSVLYIGLTIVDGVESGTAMDTPWDETNQTGDRFYDVNGELTNTTASAYTMAGIMPIVLIAIALLGAMMGLMYVFGRNE
jgi:hypothetical protein